MRKHNYVIVQITNITHKILIKHITHVDHSIKLISIDLFDIKPAHAHICQISVLGGNIENGGLVEIPPPPTILYL